MAKPVNTDGIQWPITSGQDRSTTVTSQKIWAAAFEPIDNKAAEEVLKEKSWRFKYTKYVIEHLKQSLASREAALNAARGGLEKMYTTFEFNRDGKTLTFDDAMKTLGEKGFHTGITRGTKPKPKNLEFEVPYKGRNLSGEQLISQLKRWSDYGTIEKSAADAIEAVAKNPGWVDLSSQTFVLLGAGAEMGPLKVLLALGANVIAVDLDRPNIWKRLIALAKDSCGTLTYALKVPEAELKGDDDLYSKAGCDLIKEAPEILNWLKGLLKNEKPVTIGCYVYLDSEAHVRVALACDAIMTGIYQERKNKSSVALAYLCTPTDVHLIPEEANQASFKEFKKCNAKTLAVAPIRVCSGRMLVKNALKPIETKSGKFYYVDGLVVNQGPNYALAKRMQHWRAILAHDAGCVVSSNVAPSTATISVVHNKQFAWAYDGMPFFRPMEIFEPATSNAVMGALLLHDVSNEGGVAKRSSSNLRNPYELFSTGAFHGGVWRAAYKVGTIGEVSVMVHFGKVLRPLLLLALLVVFVAILLRRRTV